MVPEVDEGEVAVAETTKTTLIEAEVEIETNVGEDVMMTTMALVVVVVVVVALITATTIVTIVVRDMGLEQKLEEGILCLPLVNLLPLHLLPVWQQLRPL